MCAQIISSPPVFTVQESRNSFPVHPLGSRARVLLTSVFGPYAQDDESGSRAINPMELYHNQVTRVQRAFSLRMFHRSWGIMMIQANISAPCALLDFPTLKRFIEEIKTHRYDIVGISAILPNVVKVGKMCELIREHLPEAIIVVGGHVANLPGLKERVNAGHIVQGEGVRWMRRFLGEDEDQPIKHPRIISGIGGRCLGVSMGNKPGDAAATLAALPFVLNIVMGIWVMWLYAALRPHLGAGPKTAAVAAVALWIIASLEASKFGALGFIPLKLLLVPVSVALPVVIVAVLAGAWLYKE